MSPTVAPRRKDRRTGTRKGEGGRFPTAAYVAILGAALLCYAALGAVVRILPEYVPRVLGAGPFAVGLCVGAPALTAIFTRPLGGRAADLRGPLPVLLTGAVVMALGAPAALVPSLPVLVASRLAVGAGEGLMMSATALWLLRLGGEDRRGRSIGHVGLANYGGLVAGPLLAVALGGAGNSDTVFLASTLLPLAGAALVLAAKPGAGEPAAPERRAPLGELLGWTLRPGLGLTLVNIGYAALISFGAAAIAANGAGGSSLVIPVFAAVVILTRTAGGAVPDRAGPERVLLFSCPAAAAGLAGVGLLSSTPLVVASIALLAAGQALAVPALGAMALRDVPPSQHGATAGLFFAWFDAGVGLGGPIAGVAAALAGADGALITAGALVATAPLVAGAAPRVRRRVAGPAR
jgi:predicted MFS family arabinose efflux permease